MTPAVTPQPQAAQPQTLAQTVKAKYPGVYDDLDDHVLENKILAKYPQYSDLPRTPPRPIQEAQPAPQPGFWSSLGSDLKGMVPHQANPYGDQPLPGRAAAAAQAGEQSDKELTMQNAVRKAAGYSLPYRALAPVAEGLGANVQGMEQSARQGDPGGVLGHAAAVPLTMAATEGVAHGLPFLKNALPSKTRAGANFQTVMSAAKDVPVDTTAPGNTALQIKDFAGRGGRQPKVVTDFIRRATDPTKGPITYEEARDFASNASQLSAEEKNALKPNVRRMVGKFARDMNESNAAAAAQAGVGPQYQSAMKEYSRAMTMQDFQNMLKGTAVNAVKYGVPTAIGGTVGAHVARKVLNAK
jgi:hypothetical protein